MRQYIHIVERLLTEASSLPDLAYYLEEGCGIFAVALARIHGNGQIFVISNRHGERWNRTIPEFTHVFCRTAGQDYDVKGRRSLAAMAADFHLEPGDWNLLGPYEPKAFQKKFMGNGDRFPLYGGADDIKAAMALIRTTPDRYGLAKMT